MQPGDFSGVEGVISLDDCELVFFNGFSQQFALRQYLLGNLVDVVTYGQIKGFRLRAIHLACTKKRSG